MKDKSYRWSAVGRPRGRPLHPLGSGTSTARPPRRCGTTRRSSPSSRSTTPTSSCATSSRPTAQPRLRREFIDERWAGEAAPRTRKKVRAVLMSFFKWAQAEFKLHGNPVVPDPLRRGSAMSSASCCSARGRRSDRRRSSPSYATGWPLKLLFLMGLRKGELAATPLPRLRPRRADQATRCTARAARSGRRQIPTEELRSRARRALARARPAGASALPAEAGARRER